MSRLAPAITRALEELNLTQTQFAETAGLTRVQVNRACRGTGSIGREVIGKIGKALPAPHNTTVVAAWVQDEVPPDLADLVHVETTDQRVSDEPPPRPRPSFDKRREDLLLWVERNLNGTEFCDMLESLRLAFEAK